MEPAARLGETWWLGLRLLKGVEPGTAQSSSGASDFAAQVAQELALRLVGLGLLESSNGAFRLTARGLPLADAVAREFLDLARTAKEPTGPLG